MHAEPGREDGSVQQAGSASHQDDQYQRGRSTPQEQRPLPNAAHHPWRFGAGRTSTRFTLALAPYCSSVKASSRLFTQSVHPKSTVSNDG